jgi:hypothetical protein
MALPEQLSHRFGCNIGLRRRPLSEGEMPMDRQEVGESVAAYCPHFGSYNFCRIHKMLRVTAAMETGTTDRVWMMADVLA